jgi:hypothetical protein
MTALKYAHEVRSPPSRHCYVSDLYIDMHAFGKGARTSTGAASEVKTLFLMYKQERPPGHPQGAPRRRLRLLIEVNEMLSGEPSRSRPTSSS